VNSHREGSVIQGDDIDPWKVWQLLLRGGHPRAGFDGRWTCARASGDNQCCAN
jgi:hypothetical protein